jgi:TPP-dependent pyruvate/acetoin dehydrogenase alpha subunit
LRDRLIEKGAISASELDVLEAEVEAEVEYAAQVAIHAPEPSIDEAYTDIFCEGGALWRN